jgi:hypothetical protein
MFDYQFLPFDNAFRELGATPLESPAWEADPSQFPFESGVEWNKLILDSYTYDIGGPPDVLDIAAEPGSTYTGAVTLAGPTVVTEVARNSDLAVKFNGADALYEDTDPTSSIYGDGTDWTVFSVVCPRSFGSVGGTDGDGHGVWAFSDYFVGLTMFNDGGANKLRLYAFDSGGSVGYPIDLNVHAGRWCVSAASLGKDLVLRGQVGLDRSGTAAMPSGPVTGATVVQFGYNSGSLQYGEMDLAVYAVSPSGSLPVSRVRDIVRYLEAVYGPQVPCLVLLAGQWAQVPATAPYGSRISFDSGAYVCEPTTGSSLVLSAGQLSTAANEEDVRVPPP